MESLVWPAVALIAQTPQEPDPTVVTPGLFGLGLTVALGLAMYLLYRSMIRHVKRAQTFHEEAATTEPSPADEDEQPPTQ